MGNPSQFEHIKRKSVTELVTEQILAMIQSGQFQPGDKLPSQKELETMMNVSRPTLREAMSRLIVMGLLEARQGQGYFVTRPEMQIHYPTFVENIDQSKMQELLEARIFFESSLAQMAAIMATDEEIAELMDYVTNIERPDNPSELEGNRFHQMVADIAHNSILANFERSLLELFEEFKGALLSKKNSQFFWKYEMEPHAKIAQAIKDRDPQKAYEESVLHIINYAQDIGLQEKYQDMLLNGKFAQPPR